MNKLSLPQLFILSLLVSAVFALIGLFSGAVLTGDAGEAVSTVNAAYEARFQMTPMAPLIYPADFVVCRAGVTETITVPDDLQWNYQVLLANKEAEKGLLYFGGCQ